MQGLRISKAAALCLQLEGLKLKISNNEPVDQDLFLRMCGTFARLLERIEAKTPKPEPEKPKPYWEPPFHRMTDADFWKWIEERGVTSDACATEKRAREHLVQQAAWEADRPRRWAELVAADQHRITYPEREGHTSSHQENKIEMSEDEREAAIYERCGVEL